MMCNIQSKQVEFDVQSVLHIALSFHNDTLTQK